MKCSCGAELKEEGLLCETSLHAIWSEEKNTFELNLESLSLKDFEIKCPNCYGTDFDFGLV